MSTHTPVVVLHVGAMKTGTTYLQHKLIANRDELHTEGVDFAGGRWRDQVSAVQDLLSLAQDDPKVARRSAGAWTAMAKRVRRTDARMSLLSMEFLSFADTEEAQRAVDSLAGLDVHVVVTVRDTAAVIPALWQTSITSGGGMTWPRFMTVARASMRGGGRLGSALARAGVPTARRFSEAVDIPRILRVWAAAVPPERVHVVVVPGPQAPRDRLWELFTDVLGVDPATAPHPPVQENESLGLPSAELVRRVNVGLSLQRPTEQRMVKVELAGRGLGELRHEERRARLDPATFRAALRWNARIRDVITSTGVTVHGDLADLPTEADPATYHVDAAQRTPSDEELLVAARHGYLRMRKVTRKHVKGAFPRKRRKAKWRKIRRQLAKPTHWEQADDPVAAAVADLGLLVTSAIGLERKAEKRRRKKRKRARLRARRAARAQGASAGTTGPDASAATEAPASSAERPDHG